MTYSLIILRRNSISNWYYQLVNAGLNFEISNKKMPIEITTGVNNLLNTKYIDHLSRFKYMGIANQGVNYYFGVKIKFNKQLKDK